MFKIERFQSPLKHKALQRLLPVFSTRSTWVILQIGYAKYIRARATLFQNPVPTEYYESQGEEGMQVGILQQFVCKNRERTLILLPS